SNPDLWDVNNPSTYDVRFQLYQNVNLIDQKTSQISFRKIELIGNKLFLNNKPIVIRGITYFESNGVKNSFFRIKDYERDLNLIKDLTVNAIFVRNSFPSDELIEQCERNGILVFFDLDSKTYPSKQSSQLLLDKKRKLNYVVEKYSNYSCVVGINLGLLNQAVITVLKKYLEKNFPNFRILTFVESDELISNEIKDFDFVAYNFLHKSVNDIEKTISKLDNEKFIFISAVGYNHGINEEEGYSNPYSIQAQAKYLSDLLKILTEKNISFFIHTFSDYRLPYHSIVSGKLDNELMKYGLVNEYRDKKKLSYYVLKSYLNESKLPLIMQGNFTENANVIYVVIGLLFLALTIITINSTHRFRENVSRAILKTYNFFSDIRDGWFISSFHSIILAITIALSTSLTYSSLLYYWKDKIDFERFISLFNSNLLFEFVSYVAWHPVEAIIYFTLILILVALILTVAIKFFNLFVKNKIFLNHAFLIVVWSAIPFLILIPLGMVAFKVLSLKKYDQLIYLIVILFHLWVFTRTLKGISIVFEVKKSRVYFVSICMMILLLAILILYLEINFSSLGYFTEYFG
ncbi:MAG: glycoside hydrolase family 2 TIM barrel-domain containing protein, partial [Ignavibacteria bacterium]